MDEQLYPSFSSISMRSSWILNDLFVAERFRKRGVARLLMDTAREFAEGVGAKERALSTGKENKSAQRLYESLGYKKDEEFFHYYYTIERLS